MTIIDAARAAYENLPEDENHPDRVQQKLAVIDGEDHDAYAALAIIDHVGAAFEAQDDGEAATRALGSALCEAAVMLWRHRLAISPVLELVRENCQPGSAAQPVEGPAKLARAVRKGAGLNLEDLVSALALSLAQALDSVQIMHAVTVDLGQLFVHVARELIGWKTLVVGPEGGAQRVYRLRPAAEQRDGIHAPLYAREALAKVDYGRALRDGADAIARTGSREEEGRALAARLDHGAAFRTVWSSELADANAKADRDDALTANERMDARAGGLPGVATDLGNEDVTTPGWPDLLAHAKAWKRRLCPVCAGPMSYLRDNLYGCGQHEHQEEHLRNLGLTQEDLDHMRAAPAPTAG